jgi:hypothetical protein
VEDRRPNKDKDQLLKSDYTYQFRKVKGVYFVMLEDQDLGGATLTNNIHNVIIEIAKKETIDPREYTYIYKDSLGVWDGYNFSLKQFFPVREKHWLKAAVKTVKQIP